MNERIRMSVKTHVIISTVRNVNLVSFSCTGLKLPLTGTGGGEIIRDIIDKHTVSTAFSSVRLCGNLYSCLHSVVRNNDTDN